MGDRTSIQFVNDDEKSPVFYEHNGGIALLHEVDEFLEVLKQNFPLNERCNDPITRREPSAILVMFVAKYVKYQLTFSGGYRLRDSDVFYRNNDNGHWIINLKTMKRHERRK